MRSSIKQVAQHAGVSIGTVSHVLNHPHLVSPETAERVRAAMDALGYVRNETARQLVRGRSDLVGLVVPDITDSFFLQIIDGAQEAVERVGSSLVISSSGADRTREQRHLDLLEERRVRGVVLSPAVDEWFAGVGDLQRRGTPLALLGPAFGHRDFCAVSMDEEASGRLVGAHLAEGGHRDVVFVATRLDAHHTRARRRGLEAAVPGARVSTVDATGWAPGRGLPAVRALLDRPAAQRPTAVFATYDLIAVEVLAECAHLGLAVPGDVAVVGHDDLDAAASAVLSLTSVDQPRRRMGATAVELMLGEEAEGLTHDHRSVLLQPQLRVRRSSGPARG